VATDLVPGRRQALHRLRLGHAPGRRIGPGEGGGEVEGAAQAAAFEDLGPGLGRRGGCVVERERQHRPPRLARRMTRGQAHGAPSQLGPPGAVGMVGIRHQTASA
jgi:hypothetical protein